MITMYFEAFERDRDWIAQVGAPAGCTTYERIFVGVYDPLVLVVINAPRDGGFAFRQTFLIWRVADLLKEVGLKNGSMEICPGMMLLSPGHMNQKGIWQMDAISEVWGGRTKESSEVVIERYHLADGRRLVAPRDQRTVERRVLEWERLI